jgi:DNA-directed RNA polymerase subunit RPC12/RpoP
MSNEADIICDTCHHENHVDLDTVNIMNIECEECGENVFEFRREHG